MLEEGTSFDVKCGAEDYGLLQACSSALFGGTWVQFSQIYLMPKYPNAAIT